MKNTTLTPDQTGTLLDLVNDQIRTQRVYLKTTPLMTSHMKQLTHLRNIKKELARQERANMRAEALEMQEANENQMLFTMFHS